MIVPSKSEVMDAANLYALDFSSAVNVTLYPLKSPLAVPVSVLSVDTSAYYISIVMLIHK